ncbi:MAG: hypothetical protein QXZ70_07625, partial [Candidatus Bathyarchaeia archaeon]
MDEGRKGAYKKVAWILITFFLLSVPSLADDVIITPYEVILDEFNYYENWVEYNVEGYISNGSYVISIISTSNANTTRLGFSFSPEYSVLVMKYKSEVGGVSSIPLIYIDNVDCSGFTIYCKESLPLIADNTWRTLYHKITSANWTDNDGNISAIRMYLAGVTNLSARLYIDYIKFVKPPRSVTASIGSVSADTLYYIQNVYVFRDDATDIRFCTDTACTQVVTPSYFWVDSVTQLSPVAYRANIYVSFSSSYSQLYMQSYNTTAYLTPSTVPPKTTTPGQPIYAINTVKVVMVSNLGISCSGSATLYLNNTNNQGYNILTQARSSGDYCDVEIYTTGTYRGAVWSPATVSIEWSANSLTYYWPSGSATITPSITRTTNLVPDYMQNGMTVTSFYAYTFNTSKTFTIIDQTAPSVNITSISWQQNAVNVAFQMSDNSICKNYEVKLGSTTIASGDVYASTWGGNVSIPYTSIGSLPATLTVLVYDIVNNAQSVNVTLTDTVLPSISASITVSALFISISFSASDNTFLKNYAILLNNEQLTSENIYEQTFSKTVTYSTNVLIGKTNPTFTVIVYDAAGNSNSTTLNMPKTGIIITILDENRNAALNFTNFQELYIYLVSENQKTYVVRNGQYLGNLQNDTTINLLTNFTETIRITWLYKNYPDYYTIEIMPIIANVLGNPIVVGIPGLINNTTIPYLYEFLVLSNDKKPVIIERVNPKVIKFASATLYPYDRYLTASTFLQREIYNLYTVEGGVLVFLSAVDGGRAQAVNIDALLAQKKPITMIYGVTL